MIGMWFSLVQLQNPARSPAAMIRGSLLPLARQHDFKAMAATLKVNRSLREDTK